MKSTASKTFTFKQVMTLITIVAAASTCVSFQLTYNSLSTKNENAQTISNSGQMNDVGNTSNSNNTTTNNTTNNISNMAEGFDETIKKHRLLITDEMFLSMKKGMSYQQIKDIMKMDGKLMSSIGEGHNNVKMYSWGDDAFVSLVASFKDGKLTFVTRN